MSIDPTVISDTSSISTDVPSAESGQTTTEFIASALASLAVLLAPTLNWHITADEQAALVTLLWSAYSISRGIRKRGTGA